MIISLSRTGGFTGIPLKKTVDTQKLPVEDAKKIEELVSSANFFTTSNASPSARQPDQFSYNISIQHNSLSRTISINETSLSEQMRELIKYLRSV